MVKTNKLTGPALDWAVAKCWYGDEYDMSIPLFEDGKLFAPSTTWAHGGPIIERERILLDLVGPDDDPEWEGRIVGKSMEYGPTPLIAAMRCYVASKLGDDIEVPDELLEFA